jgi:hypothetical protein
MGANQKTSLPLRFNGGQTRKSNKSIMLASFLGFPHGFELLEGNIHDQTLQQEGVSICQVISQDFH